MDAHCGLNIKLNPNVYPTFEDIVKIGKGYAVFVNEMTVHSKPQRT